MKIYESQVIGDLSIDSDLSVGGNIINKDLSQSLQSILQACDGYGGATPGAVTATEGADGYLVFFTGSAAIAGDNDLHWDRVNNRLGIHNQTPVAELDVVGQVRVDGYANFLGNVAVTGQVNSLLRNVLAPSGTTLTIDWNSGNAQILSLEDATGDVTLTFINAVPGGSYILKIIQDSAAPLDIIWPAECLWPDAVTPVISTDLGAIDVASLFFDSANYFCNIGQSYG